MSSPATSADHGFAQATFLLVGAALLVVVGCRGANDPDRAPAPADGPTWGASIEPTIRVCCSPCHRSGGAAPFALSSADEVRRRSRKILSALRSRTMPPWLPGPASAAFAGDRRLDEATIERFAAWVEAGTPGGEPGARGTAESEATRAPGAPRPLGDADLVLTVDRDLALDASTDDRFVDVELPLPLERRAWIEAVDVDRGDPRRVEHALVRLLRSDGTNGGVIAMAAAGRGPWIAPAGSAWPAAPGDRLALRLFVVASPRATRVRPQMRLRLTDGPPAWTLRSLVVDVGAVTVPAREAAYRVEASIESRETVDVVEVIPDAHLLCRGVRVTIDPPGAAATTLLDIADWDLHWQEGYRLVEPLPLAPGTRIVGTWSFDNTRDNPRNPHVPLVPVSAGPRIDEARGSAWLVVRARR